MSPAYYTYKNVFLHRHVGNPEDGGDGYLIGAHRCAIFKVPQKDIYHASKDPVTGKTVYKGNTIIKLGSRILKIVVFEACRRLLHPHLK
jgi:hypothetical protein